MIGRVMAIVMLMGFGITPLSYALSGALIDVNATALFAGGRAPDPADRPRVGRGRVRAAVRRRAAHAGSGVRARPGR